MSNGSYIPSSTHILAELGFGLTRVGDELCGSAPVSMEMFAPGTTSIRTSILAILADTAAGRAAMSVVAPRVPVTLTLDVHLFKPSSEPGIINVTTRVLLAERPVVVVEIFFAGSDGKDFAFGTASFTPAPNQALTMPPEILSQESLSPGETRLRLPLAERARCEVHEPGIAVLPRSQDGLNASNTFSGGLIALAVEEAALSLTPGATLSSMTLRFVRPLRVGPAVASAQVRAGLGSIEVRDAGADHRLAVTATTRSSNSCRQAGST